MPRGAFHDRLVRRAGLLGFGLVGVVVALICAALVLSGRDQPATAQSSAPVRDLRTMESDEASRLRMLRDAAIECMGWAAGNSFRRQIWPEVESFVGQRGLYYDAMLKFSPPGLADDLREAELAVSRERYEDAFVRGRQAAFDEDEVARCLVRTREISDELERMLESEREPRTIGSPVSIDEPLDEASR